MNFLIPRTRALLIGVSLFFSFSVSAQEKLKSDEIISRHLDSIGFRQSTEGINGRVFLGSSKFSILRSSSGFTNGTVRLCSENRSTSLDLIFDSGDYPLEQLVAEGGKVHVAFISPGLRSPLGNFVLAHKSIVSEGLLFGALSSSWSMLDLTSRKAKVKSAGKRKIDGREVYAIEYMPREASELTIKLYFDLQTFQHVRTEYSQTLSAAQGLRPEDSSRQIESRHELKEEFSDFRSENGLMLPHRYGIELSITGSGGTIEYAWKSEFSQFLFNQKCDRLQNGSQLE